MSLDDFRMQDLYRVPIPRNFQLEELSRLNSQLERAAAANSASRFVELIAQQVREFESQLDLASEVGAYLVSFGQAVTIHVKSILAVEPSLVVIEGTGPNSQPVRLVQHTSQISFLLVKVPRLNPDEPRRPIGFSVEASPSE